MHKRVKHKCLLHNIVWETSPSSTIQGCGCPKCNSEKINASMALSHEEYAHKLALCNPDAIIMDTYINAKTMVNIFHKKCGHITKMLPYGALAGRGCYLCVGKSISNALMISTEEYVDKLIKMKSDVRPADEYRGVKTSIKHMSLNCDHIWITSPDSVLQGNGCPICSESRGEKLVQNFLDEHNIFHIRQHDYVELLGVGGKKLSYDFYLPEYNLLIEFQGEQHEHPIEFFGGIKKFIKQKIHDTRKRKYCHEHNINFLEIWYYEINKIEQRLEQYLNNLKSESVETTGVA